jgi:aminotransferase
MISVFGSDLGNEEIQQVRAAIQDQWMGMGPRTKRFESLLAERLAVPDVALVDSGSNALLLAMHVMDLAPGSEVILPSLTWVSCAHAILLARCRPIFCDVDLESCNVTAELIEPHLSSHTSAILVVHYAGLPVNLDPILAFEYPVLEDAAHAIDSKIGDRYCGTLGVMGILSFDPVKNLATCDAGAVVGSAELVKRAKDIRYCGIKKSGLEAAVTDNFSRWWEHDIVTAFPRVIPNDIAAALGLAQLSRLPQLQERRRQIWQAYQNGLADIGWVQRPPDAPAGSTHSYFTYLIRVPAAVRDELAHFLYDAGVYTTLRYYPLHKTGIYRTGCRLVNTETIAAEGLNIPLHPRLTDADVDRIIGLIRRFGDRM